MSGVGRIKRRIHLSENEEEQMMRGGERKPVVGALAYPGHMSDKYDPEMEHRREQQRMYEEQQRVNKNILPDMFNNGGQGGVQGYNPNAMPLTEENQVLNSLLANKHVPKDILSEFWFVFGRDNVLTFLDEDRKKDKLLAFDIVKIDMLHTKPYYEYTFEEEKVFNTLRLVYETKLDRALGTTKPNQVNERIVQRSQFSENRVIQNDKTATPSSSYLSRLFKR